MGLAAFNRMRRIKAAQGAEEASDCNSITKSEIIKKLTEKEIKHNPRDKKEILLKLLTEDDE